MSFPVLLKGAPIASSSCFQRESIAGYYLTCDLESILNATLILVQLQLIFIISCKSTIDLMTNSFHITDCEIY